MKVAIALGGTDLGRSGIGTYVRELLPRLADLLAAEGGELVAMGTAKEIEAFAPALTHARSVALSSIWDRPGPSAIWHMARAGHEARRAGCDMLLLPAGNRRVTWTSPIPVVAVVHDIAQIHVAGKYDPMRMAYLRRVILPGLAKATRLVSVSRATRTDLEKVLHFAEGSTDVVTHGVDTGRFRPADAGDARVAAARQHHGLRRSYVLYLSRLEVPNKNHIRLLQAYAQSAVRSTHELVFAGPDWGGQKAIEAEIARLRLGDDVRLLGFVPSEHLAGIVAGAEALTMVAMFEGFGLPALEALSCGVPVVSSITGALPEVVGSQGVPCDPSDVASIRDALEAAVLDVALRAKIRTEGPAWARAHGWDASAGALLDVCHAVGRAA